MFDSSSRQDKTKNKQRNDEKRNKFNEIKYAYEKLNGICQSGDHKMYHSTKKDDYETKEDNIMYRELFEL